MHFPAPVIRPLAICVIQRDDRILVAEGFDTVKAETFYRPLGGGIEFGESGQAAVIRELREELKAELVNVEPIGTVENIYVYNGRPGHEIVLIYAADLQDASLYATDVMNANEDDGTPFRCLWKRLDSFGPGVPLYPDGLLELLESRAAR